MREEEIEGGEKEEAKKEDGGEGALASPPDRDGVNGNAAGAAAAGAGEKGEAAAAAADKATAAVAALPPLEASVVHPKLEGTASREKRRKLEERLAKLPPPDDPPEDVDLARRRGGLG